MHRGTIAGKLNGAIPAQTPRGSRYDVTSVEVATAHGETLGALRSDQRSPERRQQPSAAAGREQQPMHDRLPTHPPPLASADRIQQPSREA
jgi:hypothetical protein